jgi:hypothetical protein
MKKYIVSKTISVIIFVAAACRVGGYDPNCLTLNFEPCMGDSGMWYYEGCNGLLNQRSMKMLGLVYPHYAFSLTTATVQGWYRASFPYNPEVYNVLCSYAFDVTLYPLHDDCTGASVDLGAMNNYRSGAVGMFDYPDIEPECYNGA